MNEMTINFNGQNYIAVYNEQSGYYEVNLTAPSVGGIYNSNIKFTDLFGQSYEDTKAIQILAKEQLKIESNKVFMWIFDYKDFTVKDIVEIADYEINIDEETNASSSIKVLKKTTAKSRDIVAIKKNNEVIFWGTIKEILNENGKMLYEYTLKYITNIFDENVALSINVNDDIIEDGIYRIRTALASDKAIDVANSSLEDGANVEIYEKRNSQSQKWKIYKNDDGYYTIQNLNSGKVLDVFNSSFVNDTNVQQYYSKKVDAQKWQIERAVGTRYRIKTKTNNLCLTVEQGETENGTNVKIYEQLGEELKQKFVLEKLEEEMIKNDGIEDYIEKTINDNFVKSKDTFINKDYIQIKVKTHTKLQTSVSNVTDGIYNLHTFMANCTQLYNINYNVKIENKKLIIEIENKSNNKELIDIQAQAISNYTEVFETDVVSKVVVLTSTDTHTLYLLNDRTTTTDAKNENRADGRTETVYTEKYEEANQKALDTMKSNSYNHNITFSMLDKVIKVGTPIAIKTKESLIFDTYISAIKITPSKFVDYTCGNIRIKFIDKLLKERRK